MKLRVTLYPALELEMGPGFVSLSSPSGIVPRLGMFPGHKLGESWAALCKDREQQGTFCWVVKLWGYRSGPISSHLVHCREILPKSEVSKENRAKREWRMERNQFCFTVFKPQCSAVPRAQLPGLFQLSRLCVLHLSWASIPKLVLTKMGFKMLVESNWNNI